MVGERRGYPVQGFDFHENYATAIVTGDGLDSEHIVFRLKPAGSIRGRVTDDFNEPQRGMSVILFYSGVLLGGSTTRLVRTVKTDDHGVYALPNLPAGKYFIAVSGRPWYAKQLETLGGDNAADEEAPKSVAAKRSQLDVAYPVTFYPRVSAASNASPILLKFGEHFTADVQLHAVPSIHVSLKTHKEQQFGLPVIRQRLFDANELQIDADAGYMGEDELGVTGLAPGRYIVEFSRAGAPAFFRSEVEWLGDTTLNLDSLAAEPTMAQVAGTIKFDGQLERGRTPDVVLRNTARGQLHQQSVGIDGSFAFKEGLASGTYEVGVANAPGFFVWGISATGAVASGTRLEIRRAQSVELSVVVTRAVGTVEGTALKDGKAMAGAMIVLVPQNQKDVSLYRRDQSDSDGTFVLSSVLPGSYTLVALQSWDVEWSNPKVLSKYLPQGKPVQAQGGAAEQVQVEVQ